MGWQDSTGAMSSLFPCQSPHRCLHCGFWPHVPGVQERGVWPHRRHGWVFTHHQESFWGTWDLLHKHHPGWWHKPSPCQCPDLCKWRWVHKEQTWVVGEKLLPVVISLQGERTQENIEKFLLCLEASAETAPACLRVHAKIKWWLFPWGNFSC